MDRLRPGIVTWLRAVIPNTVGLVNFSFHAARIPRLASSPRMARLVTTHPEGPTYRRPCDAKPFTGMEICTQ